MRDYGGSGPGADTDDLYFARMIRSYVDTPRFVRRQWWADEIIRQLADPGCTYVVLTAEPGAGKTGLIAQLASDHPRWPRYFLRRDQQQPLADGTAHAVLERIGFQLVAIKPELFLGEPVEVSVDQRIDAVSRDGRVVGAEVDRMVASPFKRAALKIRQDVGLAEGEVVGLRIREWVTELQLLPVPDVAAMALITPLLRAQDAGDREQIVVVLDALDEVAQIPGGQSILDWLADAPALPANLRVVVTARPSSAVETFVDRQGDRVRMLRFDPADVRVQEELRRYADGLAEAEPVRSMLRAVGRLAGDFARETADKAEGNIGYVAALGRAIDQAVSHGGTQADLESLAFLQRLPTGLRGLYRFFLRRLKDQVGDQEIIAEDPETGLRVRQKAWSSVYRPLLEVLATSFDDLGLDELMALTSTMAGRGDVTDALDHLSHLLDRNDGRYRFHHATIAEFLTAAETAHDPATASLVVDAAAVNRHIARTLAGVVCGTEVHAAPPASAALRYYALAFLPAHLVTALNAAGGSPAVRPGLREELRRVLINPGFIESKVSEVGIQPMLTDFAAADPHLGAGTDVVRRMYYLLAAESRNLQARQQGDRQPLGRPYFGTLEGDYGRLDRFQAPWLTRSGFTVQQLLNRALSAGDSELAEEARAELERRSLPRVELQWAASTSPPQIFDSGIPESHSPERVVAMSPDGRWILTEETAGPEPMLTVWDTETGTRAIVWTTEAESAANWAVTADGRIAMAGTRSGSITVWDLRDAKCAGRLAGSGRSITALTVAENGAWVAAADEAGQVQVWDLLTTDTPPRSLETPLSSMVTCMAVLRCDRGVVGATQDGRIYVWELDTTPRLIFGSHGGDQGLVCCIAVSPDGRVAARGSAGTVTVVDLDSHERRTILAAPEPASRGWQDPDLISLAFLDGGGALAGAFRGREYPDIRGANRGDRVVAWDVGTGRLLADYTLEAGWSRTRLAARAPRAFSIADDGWVAGWRLELGQHALSPHPDAVTGVAIAERVLPVIQGERGGVIAGERG